MKIYTLFQHSMIFHDPYQNSGYQVMDLLEELAEAGRAWGPDLEVLLSEFHLNAKFLHLIKESQGSRSILLNIKFNRLARLF